jgi:hypothetical protein
MRGEPEGQRVLNEAQAFLPSYDLAPIPTPFPLSLQQVVSLSQSSCVLLVKVTDGRGVRGVRGAKS